MKQHATLLIGVLLCMNSASFVYAQKGVWNWPDDRATAEEKNVLYTDYMGQGAYAKAIEPLEWLLAQCPKLNPSIYINGVRIYSSLAKDAEGDVQTKYQKRTMDLFDARVEHFGGAAQVANRKAMKGYQFYRKDTKQLAYLRNLFDEAIRLNQEKIYTPLLAAYMDVLQRQKKVAQSIKDEDVLDQYLVIVDLIEKKQAAAVGRPGEEKKVSLALKSVNNIFVTTVAIDCKFIDRNFGNQLRQNPDNTVLARRVLGLLQAKGCKNDALYIQALRAVYQSSPSYALGRALARKYVSLKAYDKALKYYERLAALAKGNNQKAALALDLAKVYTAQDKKAEARIQTRKAVELGDEATRKGAYNVLGSLYMGSYEVCRKGESRVADKAIFLAAYEAFKRAGNTQMMNTCSVQFPTIGELFELGLKEGDKIHIGCWIQEDVLLRKAP